MLAAKCGDAVAGKLIDQDGNVVTGNTAAVATWTAPNTEVDTQKYRNSRYNSDVEVTNTFDDADVNYWANDDEKITYLSRSAWDTTYPTTLETLTVNDKLYNGLNMQTYVKAADAKSVSDFNLGVELDEKINFSDMIGVAFDDPEVERLPFSADAERSAHQYGRLQGHQGCQGCQQARLHHRRWSRGHERSV